ncbi:ABC transporter ATP-binding protein [Propioniciclava tarda]|uniref:ABC transporter ATP-binding protein n=1 Tax=Propioniciclava tarda TaxID=433330 RepID=A0A4Q9KK74_PROTD|nr:ABC transporter ATP-binding protein [Propioniciclava tarda]TBT94260.1 ABC transporter ATP-binding protein [Propioniciclava tarda]SMO73493.1 peptide/nickel transport system ATP-binding protein [Propioniciclava tarda]
MSPATASKAFLEVDNLSVHFPTDDGLVRAVDGVSFTLQKGRTLGIVGESGSGKSVTSLAIMGLHRGTRAKLTGHIRLDGQDLTELTDEELRQLRGNKMAMIFQDPLSAMHPYYTIGQQLVEAIQVHSSESKKAARTSVVEMLGRVGIPNPNKRVDQYPHEFSGGMRQRAMIAMALINNPELLIADEPTTALDVTVQAQILDLMRGLQREFGSAIIMITHDLGVVAEIADQVLVMYGGKCVEYGTVDDSFHWPDHPYTWGLLTSMPRLDRVKQERLVPVVGNPPSLINVPPGCAFHPRCAFRALASQPCDSVVPELAESYFGHLSRCHIPVAQRAETFASDIAPKL